MTDINSGLSGLYNVFKASMPNEIQLFITVFAFAIIISLYVIFILKFSKFIATKDFLKLNLKKYNTSQHQVVSFLLGIVFYFTEYILVLPFLILFWYTAFSLFFLLLAEELSTGTVLLISTIVLCAIRIISYYKEDFSIEMAKLFPLTLLAATITNSSLVDLTKIISQISEIPSFFNQIFVYFILIFSLEIILRLFDLMFLGTTTSTEENEED